MPRLPTGPDVSDRFCIDAKDPNNQANLERVRSPKLNPETFV